MVQCPSQVPRPTHDSFAAWNEALSIEHDQDAYFTSGNPLVRWVGRQRLRRSVFLLQVQSEERVLDLGCGNGNLLAEFDRGELHGVDLSEVMVHRASALLGNRAKICHAPAEATGYPDGFFHKIVCSEVLEHVLDPRAVLFEMRRLLRPGGIAVVTIPHEYMIRTAKRICQGMGLRSLLRLGDGKDVMPLQNPWHLHDGSRAWFAHQNQKIFAVEKTVSIPRFLPLHFVFKLRHPSATPMPAES